MRYRRYIWALAAIAGTVISGCTQQPAAPEQKEETVQQPDVELVPARKSEEKHSRKVVVEQDGKFYEMLEEHERLCHDCDR